MAKIVKVILIISTTLLLALFLTLGLKFGFNHLFDMSFYIYETRWRNFESAEKLVETWGLKDFNSYEWSQRQGRAPQALNLYFSGYLEGKTKNEIQALLGPSDGHYSGSDRDLSYILLDETIDVNGIKKGSQWSAFLIFIDGNFKKMKFYRGCCDP